MPTDLPLELWLAIFDNLDVDRDRPTLFACARSCRTLVAPSYHRLYHQVTLSSVTAAQLRSLTQMLQSQSPDSPGKYVRRLSVSSSQIPIRHLNSIIPALAQNLPGVIFLQLYCPDWRTLSQHAKSTVKSGFQTVQQLELSAIHFASGKEMFDLIASFPALTSLGSTSFCPDSLCPLIPAQIRLPSDLEALDIPSHCLHIFDYLLRLKPPPHVHALRISVSQSASRLLAFGRLLEFLGPTLKSLTLYGSVDKMWCDTSRDVINDLLAGRVVSLTNNTNLRSIIVHSGIFSSTWEWHDPPSASWALSLLSQITSPHLAEISLTIVVRYPTVLDRLDWARLDEILTRPLWRNSLTRVGINVWLPLMEPLGRCDLAKALRREVFGQADVFLERRSIHLEQYCNIVFFTTNRNEAVDIFSFSTAIMAKQAMSFRLFCHGSFINAIEYADEIRSRFTRDAQPETNIDRPLTRRRLA